MATSLAALSASVTRILFLTGFPKELKTKDIHTAFAEWESVNGGFKIKWRDDTSLLIVFQDASTAKRAYLHTIAFPPPILRSPDGVSATIKPYDGSDAQTVIQTVNARSQNPTRANGRSNSISTFPGVSPIANRPPSNSFSRGNAPPSIPIPEGHINGREPSPTLPSLPTHPTLNSLINSSLGQAGISPPSDPAILAASMHADIGSGPRIGDPGKRMLGAALGVRHPALGPRIIGGNPQGGVDQAMREVQRAMGGMVVAE
ncbi:hypothetical protein MIND_00525400 [Mycena indigotica]|uniref:Thc1 RRM domain-containing protein n=1 Tax=Mycena indigotica TaxID=2126181 RepID=A0A8H6WCF6_9AGAR|nr:uncharacterized protein MIND_00525400 [Mycena indigotica]KAF7307314.1 hypothetical protein MIND_00525400 [Mycena indigotica]